MSIEECGAEIGERMTESLDSLSEAEAKEAERRLDELEQGLAVEIPAEDVLRRARAAISSDR